MLKLFEVTKRQFIGLMLLSIVIFGILFGYMWLIVFLTRLLYHV